MDTDEFEQRSTQSQSFRNFIAQHQPGPLTRPIPDLMGAVVAHLAPSDLLSLSLTSWNHFNSLTWPRETMRHAIQLARGKETICQDTGNFIPQDPPAMNRAQFDLALHYIIDRRLLSRTQIRRSLQELVRHATGDQFQNKFRAIFNQLQHAELLPTIPRSENFEQLSPAGQNSVLYFTWRMLENVDELHEWGSNPLHFQNAYTDLRVGVEREFEGNGGSIALQVLVDEIELLEDLEISRPWKTNLMDAFNSRSWDGLKYDARQGNLRLTPEIFDRLSWDNQITFTRRIPGYGATMETCQQLLNMWDSSSSRFPLM